MRALFASLSALPLERLFGRPDLLFAVATAGIISLLIVPMPTYALDLLISLNIAIAVVILMAAMFAERAVDFASFPSLLLVTTLFRLGLNISTTRSILSAGEAGHLVKAFGDFVVQGDLIVGLLMFVVLTVVQLLVISKGAERVAEVSARFTLDAMPGKQMSIDAAVRAGSLTEEEASVRRRELGRESQLFGNMDGAMKFVKGDAIAGLIITTLNLLGGVSIGVLRRGFELADALQVYAILTIGDALVAQVAALLITIASGILVTRVEAKEDRAGLGAEIKREVLGNANARLIAAGLLLFVGLMPGLPILPFLLIAALLASSSLARFLPTQASNTTLSKTQSFKASLEQKIVEAEKQKAVSDQVSPSVLPIVVELADSLTSALELEDEVAGSTSSFLGRLVPDVRDALYVETGVRFPGVRVRTGARLPANGFCIRVNDVPYLRGTIEPERLLAIATPQSLKAFGLAAEPAEHPISRGPAALVSTMAREVLEAAGVQVWAPPGVLALHLAAVLRSRARDFVGLQEVSDLVERMESAYPALVREVVPKVVSLQQLVGVLRRLVEEGVPIRDLKTIFEALGEHGRYADDELFLTEKVRAALGQQLAALHAGQDRRVVAVMLEPMIEDTVRGAMTHGASGTVLCLEPAIGREIVAAIRRATLPVLERGVRPVLLTTTDVRRMMRKLLESDLPNLPVLSFDELPGDLTVQPISRVELSNA